MSVNVVAVPGLEKKFNILSPVGGFGNHVRWLMLLDPNFQFLIKGTNISYNNQRGPDWPSYSDYISGNWANTSPEIKKEITEIFRDYDCVDLDTKITFIQEQIYHPNRTWHNWLSVEWKYRRELDIFIDFEHNYNDLNNFQLPTVILTIDPELAHKAYLKFNTSLINTTKDGFKSNIVTGVTKKNISNQHNNTFVIDASILFQPTLDRDFYVKLTNWLGLSDLYAEANIIHSLWYQAHKRAEREFVADISDIYK